MTIIKGYEAYITKDTRVSLPDGLGHILLSEDTMVRVVPSDLYLGYSAMVMYGAHQFYLHHTSYRIVC